MMFSLLLLIHSVSASFLTGGILPDGKVDKVVGAPNAWHAPVMGVDMRMGLAPEWQSLQEWNNATVGVGLGYWHLGHEKLGHAITPYIYGYTVGLFVAFRTWAASWYRRRLYDKDVSQYSARRAYVCGYD